MKRVFLAGVTVLSASAASWLTYDWWSGTQDRAVVCVTRAFGAADIAANKALALAPASTGISISVDVYFHVITGVDSKGQVTGRVTATAIDDQMKTLNGAFPGSGIEYVLRSIDYEANNSWFEMTARSPEERAAKAKLRKGGADSLNVYTIGGVGIVPAWAELPMDYRGNEALDGVVVPYWTLPGVTRDADIRGHLMIHEVGHWLGLAHTFEGSCGPIGDDISDTAEEKHAVYGCPGSPKYSCGLTKPDPINNYMDYTDDTCTNHFTAEQHRRMSDWLNVRLTL